ncbi:fungal-specific transcription factor domain-containing protein [Echria macrotheca]|uniref:Fungal-specific transcription factor domain-containing protein n=1 Tax=Echria macrotheca TaxID=438768 RepID=A0AAJ0F7J8_9PEZI|nr:fungal-specific transcription factor domain-containing protein [Echria macrotheca]
MLLYTRRAPPKEPKRRSRAGKSEIFHHSWLAFRCGARLSIDDRTADFDLARRPGCAFCKEKKKKCDEGRPQCARCVEHGTECVYEAVKPRQRKKRETPANDGAANPDLEPAALERRLSEASYLSSDFVAEGDDSDGEEGSQSGPMDLSMVVRSKSRSRIPSLAMISPCPARSPLLDFYPPSFGEFSDRPNRRALVDHFCNVLSHLIVFREETGNPFQQLVLPLTQKCSPVMNAVYALASAHLEYRGVENTEKSIYFHNQAIQGLGRLIEQNNKVNRNELLAAIMLLVYYEVLVQKGHSNIVAGHLKGALTVMLANPEPTDPTSVFLERAFRFYDVIAALSNGTAPLSAAPSPGCLQPVSPLGCPDASPLSDVDTLLGMATTLWPIIHRLADLSTLKREVELAVRANAPPSKIAVLRTEFEATMNAIETALTQWQPHLPPNFVPDEEEAGFPTLAPATNNEHAAPEGTEPIATSERARLHSIFHNALAYRHAAFVYLYRTIYTYPRSDDSVQRHARDGLRHCVATVAYEGPMGALLWPLFVTACEAMSPEDRELAARAFDALRRRQGMMNIERAWEIVQEVWRRADWADVVARLGEAGVLQRPGNVQQTKEAARSVARDADLWRKVSRDLGVSIVFG